MNNYNIKQEIVRQQLTSLINDGLKQMETLHITEETYSVWLSYSKKVLEIATTNYNADILLNYLRVVLSIPPHFSPTQKIGLCLEYLIKVLKVI